MTRSACSVYLGCLLAFGAFACRTPNSSRLANDGAANPAAPGSAQPGDSGSTGTEVDCATAAAAAKLSPITTKQLCEAEDPQGKAQCIVAATETLTAPQGSNIRPASPINTVYLSQLCGQPQAGNVAECVRAARLAGLGSTDTSSLCNSASLDVKNCIVAASEPLQAEPGSFKIPAGPLSSFTITNLCGNATPDIAGCISAARKAGMSSSTAYTSCKQGGGGGSNAACIQAASATLQKSPDIPYTPTGPLGSMTTQGLCSGTAGSGVIECITTARRWGFNESNVYTLCKTGDPNASLCISASLRNMSGEAANGFTPTMPLSTFNVIGICGGTNTNAGPCVEAARLTGIGSMSLASMCSKATPDTVACIKAARPNFGQAMTDNYTTGLCTAATGSTPSCITDARAQGKATTVIWSLCKPQS